MEVSVGGYDYQDGGDGLYPARSLRGTTYPAPTHATTTYTTTYRRAPSTTTPSYANAVQAAGAESAKRLSSSSWPDPHSGHPADGDEHAAAVGRVASAPSRPPSPHLPAWY